MAVKITGRHYKLKDDLRAYVEKKLPRLGKYSVRNQAIDIVFEKHGFLHRVDVRLKDGPISVTASQEDPDPMKAVDLVFDTMERNVKKNWEKVRGKGKRRADSAPKRRLAAATLIDIQPDEVANNGKGQKVRKSRTAADISDREIPPIVEKLGVRIFPVEDFDVPDMSIDEAAEELYFRDDVFLVFHDKDEDRVSVMYRRRDGNFALVRPAFSR